ERLEDFDLSLDFTLYRTYDPQLNRWLQIDPKTSERESPYVGFANNPILYKDPKGDTIDISGLSAGQQAAFNSQVEILKGSKLFEAYHNQLVESETTYTILAGRGKKGTPTEAGQFFNPATNEVGVGEKIDAYVVAQELFHAYQKDGEFYSIDNPKPLSTIETEGDIATQYVMFEAGLGFPMHGDWSQDFMLDALNGIPDISKVESTEYQKMFQTAVDKRIDYYKQSGLNAPTYTAPNTGVKPKALEAVIRQINR
ncbi:MAG: RHS repeat-associated core domain-containing protein, partial [Cyclobacteriaceae bacterium]